MSLSIIIFCTTCIAMITCVLAKPQFRIGKHAIDSYWVVVLLGAFALLVTKQVSVSGVFSALTAATAINPLKILVLFISMTVLSIFLDEMGFFSYLASVVQKRSGKSQFRLFLYLYVTVSVLTVFTSNDIIILSFTPFICYFSKNARISPLPYLVAEFVAANTWSMALIIGNPTNIYLATSFGIGFVEYAKTMLLPTICAGTVAFFVLYLIFRRKLAVPITESGSIVVIRDKLCLTISLAHLAACTVVLAIGSYIGLEMWIVALSFAVSLYAWIAVISLIRKQKPIALFTCLRRAPWQLIPFVISMFVMILALKSKGVTGILGNFLSNDTTVLTYGFSSFLSANVINNIPMSVLSCSVIEQLTGIIRTEAVFAAIIGSNIGAFLTPIGALAGIMWSSILKNHDVSFSYASFIKVGAAVSVPTILTALIVLQLIV